MFSHKNRLNWLAFITLCWQVSCRTCITCFSVALLNPFSTKVIFCTWHSYTWNKSKYQPNICVSLVGLLCLIMTKYIIKMFFFRLVPTILQLGAHTSIVSFLHAFITQWYSNEVQECVMFLQPFFLAASFHSFAVFGHEFTILVVEIDSLHSFISASAFTNICNWTFTFNLFKKKRV